MRVRIALLLVCVAALAAGAYWWWSRPIEEPLAERWTAVVGVVADDRAFIEPFGIAYGVDGSIYVADGAHGNRIRVITPAGAVFTLAGGDEGFVDGHGEEARFSTPSGIAIDGAGTLYVADTGNDAIRRVTRDGDVSTIASGLNGPVGIAVDRSGRLIVTDTYNDRLIAIDAGGTVSPVPIDVALDTPTGVAVSPDGTIFLADTGNNAVRAISPSGVSRTLEPFEFGGFEHPIGIATDSRGSVYVSDAGARVIQLSANGTAHVLAGSTPGYRNGRGGDAQLRRPSGIIVIEPGRLLVADSGNALVRSITATTLADASPPPSPWIAPRFDVDAFEQQPLLWPLAPLYGPFEIAGTIGEARGEDAGRFHAGIDVRAEQGADVLAVRDGVVSAPLSTGSFGTLNEWVRIGELTYVHLRVGRDRRLRVTDPRFVATYDERGRPSRIRVKRGARFRTGDIVGTVNAFNHVHLNVGWGGEEYNPLRFNLVQFQDTIPPTIPRNGIRLEDASGTAFTTRERGRLLVNGPVRIIVDAWDQVDGNRPSRRLGVYALGYQVLHPNGVPVAGFEQPRETIRFDQLQMSADATRFVFAPGSGIPFYGQRRTRFLYIVTNTFRDGVASEGMWDTTQLTPGDYTLRVRVADIRGNEAIANRDVPVRVTGLDPLPGA